MSTDATCGCSQSTPSIRSSSSSPSSSASTPTVRVTSPNATTTTHELNDDTSNSSSSTVTPSNTYHHRARQHSSDHTSPTPLTVDNLATHCLSHFADFTSTINSLRTVNAHPIYNPSYNTALMHAYGYPVDPFVAVKLEDDIVFEAQLRALAIIHLCDDWLQHSG